MKIKPGAGGELLLLPDREESAPIAKRRRVLMLITTLSPGGAETQVVRLSQALQARGCTVAVASLAPPTAYAEQLAESGIALYSLHLPRGRLDWRALVRLRALLQTWQPDILHCHMFHANLLGRITRLLCPRSTVPALVSTVHSMREEPENGGSTWPREWLYRVTDCLSERTTIVCRAGLERYLRVRAVPARKLQMISNGVDTEKFSPSGERRRAARRALGLGSAFAWLAVGRLVKAKDYPNLLRACARLGRDDYILLIAGSGPLAANLEEECARRELSGRVRFAGAREDMVDLYSAADGFVMSSEFEGLSMALLEASAMALPAVVTRVGGNPEIVTDNVSGYLIDPGKSDELAAAMRKLMDACAEERRILGQAARQFCCEHYGLAAIAEQWLDLYQHYAGGSIRHGER